MKVEIKREMTINMGNYSNISPSVSISAEINDYKDYECISLMAESLFMLEYATLSLNLNEIQNTEKETLIKSILIQLGEHKDNIINGLGKGVING
jgi:hypothetical protein